MIVQQIHTEATNGANRCNRPEYTPGWIIPGVKAA